MIDAIINDMPITQGEAVAFIGALTDQEIFNLANKLRKQFNGERFSTCMIMNVKSGACTEDCKWCAQSGQYHTRTPLYPLASTEDIVMSAAIPAKAGVNRFALVGSGRKPSPNEVKQLVDSYKKLSSHYPELKPCGSLGLATESELKSLFDAGMQRYHCNIETAPSLFSSLCTSHTIDDKVKTIKAAQAVGLTVCSGGIIGMGETEEQRIEMALFLRNLQVNSIPINILLPIKGTALENKPPLSELEILRAYALFKIFNPRASIRFAAGRSLIKSVQSKAIECGVSASIVGDMLTTVGSCLEEDMHYFSSKRELI